MSSTPRLLGLLSVTLAACTTTDSGPAPSSRGAERAFTTADGALAAATSSIGRAAPLGGTVSVTVPCSRGGNLGVAGSFETDGIGTSFDVDASFRGCREAEGLLDGNLHWTSSVDGARISETWTGELDFTDATGSYHCVFDLRSVVDGTGVRFSGSLCGYDVETELDIGR